MTSAFVAAALLSAALVTPQSAGPPTEVIAELLVHGNHITSNEEIIRLSGLTIGAPFAADTVETTRRRLRATGRFDDVDVFKRLASIEDASKVLIVLLVNEGPVRVRVPDDPNLPVEVVKRRVFTNFMLAPVLEGEDGYGVTYGVRVAYVNAAGREGRVTVPLLWGGTRQAGVEFERPFHRGPFSRVYAGVAAERRTNPAFDEHDSRRKAWARVERTLGPVRIGATAGWQRVRFADLDDRLPYGGVDLTLDTRLNPVLPRNAVYATAAWTRFDLRSRPPLDQSKFDVRGYLGLLGQSVLVARVVREDADRTEPPYLTSLLGGWSNLRGFEAGAFTGDTLVSGSLELRVPVSSPLGVSKLGLSAFVDTGTAYRTSQRLGDEPWRTGIGGGAWVAVTVFQFGVSVAHGRGARTRVNFGAALQF